jgi:hypothetical protein
MQKQIDPGAGRATRPAVSICLAVALVTGSILARAQAVKAPPLPAGSTLVKVQPGMDDDEDKRQVRAHKNKFKKKDHTVDDSESDDDRKNKDSDRNDKDSKNNNNGRN